MDNSDLEKWEEWKDIPFETKYTYQASTLGRIARIKSDGTRRILSEHYSGRGWKVGLVMADDSKPKKMVCTLVSRTWLGNPPDGYCAIHKNGIKSDNRLSNLTYIPSNQILCRHNKYKSKAVAKIDSAGHIVEIYASSLECGKANGFCATAIRNRCNGKFKSTLASDGYAYAYEDSKRINYIVKKLREEKCTG